MRHSAAIILLTTGLVGSIGCGGTTSPSVMDSATGIATIGFSGLAGNGAPVSTYTESAFTVAAMSGDWSVRADYGNPAPFIQFWAAGGSTVTGEVG